MTPRQSVLTGMVAGGLFAIAWLVLGWQLLDKPATPNLSTAQRLAYALRLELWLCATLLLGVGNIARQRFFSDAHIDGTSPQPGSRLAIDQRYLQNTLEQVVLAVIGHLGLAVTLSQPALVLLPLLVSLFVVARLAFWIGYHFSGTARAFGFAATFYPTVLVYLYLLLEWLGTI